MDSIRKEFEAWIKAEWPKTSLNRCDAEYSLSVGQYVCWEVECCWRSWQASRESMVVEMPYDVMHVTNISYEDGRDDVIAAIHATGIRTK